MTTGLTPDAQMCDGHAPIDPQDCGFVHTDVEIMLESPVYDFPMPDPLAEVVFIHPYVESIADPVQEDLLLIHLLIGDVTTNPDSSSPVLLLESTTDPVSMGGRDVGIGGGIGPGGTD